MSEKLHVLNREGIAGLLLFITFFLLSQTKITCTKLQDDMQPISAHI